MVDVVIVGAGFAGLRAARALETSGHHVQVLEARERVGGRSRPGQLLGRVVDTGGQWVGAGHTRVAQLAAEAGATLLPQYSRGRSLFHFGGELRSYAGRIPAARVHALLELQIAIWRLKASQILLPTAGQSSPRAKALDAQTVGQWRDRWLRTKEARAIFDIAVRSVFCADPEQLSLLHFVTVLRANGGFDRVIDVEGGAQERVVQGGMHQLAIYLAAQLRQPVLLDAPVQAIEQSSDGVLVRHAKGEVRAKRAIVAMAPSAARKVRGEPANAARDRLGERMPMGAVIKCLVAYERPFWREQGLSGEFVSDTAPFSPVFDASPSDASSGVLVGFVGGPDAERLSAQPGVRQGAVVQSLVTAFGAQAAQPSAYLDYDWITDPWSEGCYFGLPTLGTLTELGDALRQPHGRVHWAGTETADEWSGYIEGALCSGDRVAREVLQALR
jgi:monoamine oxidase